jgi:hypothetical protein
MILKTEYEKIESYVTKDGSIIRELLSPIILKFFYWQPEILSYISSACFAFNTINRRAFSPKYKKQSLICNWVIKY